MFLAKRSSSAPAAGNFPEASPTCPSSVISNNRPGFPAKASRFASATLLKNLHKVGTIRHYHAAEPAKVPYFPPKGLHGTSKSKLDEVKALFEHFNALRNNEFLVYTAELTTAPPETMTTTTAGKVKPSTTTRKSSADYKKRLTKKFQAIKTSMTFARRDTLKSTRYSRSEELHKYMRKRVTYADSTPSNSTILEAKIDKSWWRSCLRREKRPAGLSEYQLKAPVDTRSPHTIHYLTDVHARLVGNPDSYAGGWKNMIHYEITNIFKNAHSGLRLLHVVNSFSEKALQLLSYYLEDNSTDEQMALVDGRSVIGSHMWITMEILNGLHAEHHEGALDMDTLRDMLTRIVAKASKNVQTVLHLVNQYIKAARATMRMVKRYIYVHEVDYKFLLGHAKSGVMHRPRNSIRSSMNLLAPDYKNKFREMKKYNNRDPPKLVPRKSSTTTAALKLKTMHMDSAELIWQDVRNDEIGHQVANVMRLLSAVDSTLDQVNINMHLAAKYLWHFQDCKSYTATSFAEAMLFTKRSLKSLPYGPDNRDLINLEDRSDIIELSKILQDEMELTEYFLMSLREVALETQNAIRVPYEFGFIMMAGQLPKYQIVACSDTEKLLELVLRDEDLRGFLGPGWSKKVVMNLFHTSPYKEILKDFPLKLQRQIFTMKVDAESSLTSMSKSETSVITKLKKPNFSSSTLRTLLGSKISIIAAQSIHSMNSVK